MKRLSNIENRLKAKLSGDLFLNILLFFREEGDNVADGFEVFKLGVSEFYRRYLLKARKRRVKRRDAFAISRRKSVRRSSNPFR